MSPDEPIDPAVVVLYVSEAYSHNMGTEEELRALEEERDRLLALLAPVKRYPPPAPPLITGCPACALMRGEVTQLTLTMEAERAQARKDLEREHQKWEVLQERYLAMSKRQRLLHSRVNVLTQSVMKARRRLDRAGIPPTGRLHLVPKKDTGK